MFDNDSILIKLSNINTTLKLLHYPSNFETLEFRKDGQINVFNNLIHLY